MKKSLKHVYAKWARRRSTEGLQLFVNECLAVQATLALRAKVIGDPEARIVITKLKAAIHELKLRSQHEAEKTQSPICND